MSIVRRAFFSLAGGQGTSTHLPQNGIYLWTILLDYARSPEGAATHSRCPVSSNRQTSTTKPMGFDVYGRAPRSKKGEYFRNNVWWWRPLADYVLYRVDIPESDSVEWHSNGGYEVSAESAAKIAERLTGLLKEGEVAAFARERKDHLRNLPVEQCAVCKGKRRHGAIDCVHCGGKGRVRPWATNYPFTAKNVADFAAFCRESGGFTIR
jgi:hypothetical protein